MVHVVFMLVSCQVHVSVYVGISCLVHVFVYVGSMSFLHCVWCRL